MAEFQINHLQTGPNFLSYTPQALKPSSRKIWRANQFLE